jgi:hypothetical protein
MFPSLRLMLAAVLSALVILVIASSALLSLRRSEMPMVLHPAGSRPLAASWQTDDMRSFEARFGPQAMLVNATLQLPPVAPATDRAPARLDILPAAAVEPIKNVEPAKVLEALPILAPAKPAVVVAPESTASATVERVAASAPVEQPITVKPPVVVLPATEPTVPAVVATIDAAAEAPKPERSIVVAAIAPESKPDPKPESIPEPTLDLAPAPAKDPQVASDEPTQPTRRSAAIMPAAPADARPSFVDNSRRDPIVKPAVKRRAQIKRPKKRVVRAPAPAVKPATPTNPFAALFGSSTTP